METKQNSVVPVSTYLVKLFYISRMMNQTISTMGSKTLVCLHFKTMSLLDIHTYSCIPPWMFWVLNFCLER